MEYNNLDFEINEEARQKWLEGRTKGELLRAYYWLLSSGEVTLPEYLEALMKKGRPNC